MKKTHMTLLAGGLLASSMAMAEFSANVAMTTDYVFRGFSQNDGDPAIQGGFDYSHASGFYAGVWASNVDSTVYSGASMEMDLYLGWSGEFSGWGVDVGALRYEYPNTTNNDNITDEFHIGVSHDIGPVSASLTFNYSDDFFGLEEATYVDLGLEAPVGDFTVAAHYGITDYDNDTLGTDVDDWSVGISREFGGFGFDLTYTDTDQTGRTSDGRFIFTVSKEL